MNEVSEKASEAGGAMDILTFIASVVGSVAWPIAALAIALVFRAQIRRLLERIRKLSLGDNSIDFTEELDVVEAVADAASASLEAPKSQTGSALPDDRVAQLIAISPAAAVLDVWRTIERHIFEKAEELPLDVSPTGVVTRVTFRTAARQLVKYGIIQSSTYQLLLEMQRLRNVAAHSDELTAADAVRFVGLAQQAGMYPSISDTSE